MDSDPVYAADFDDDDDYDDDFDEVVEGSGSLAPPPPPPRAGLRLSLFADALRAGELRAGATQAPHRSERGTSTACSAVASSLIQAPDGAAAAVSPRGASRLRRTGAAAFQLLLASAAGRGCGAPAPAASIVALLAAPAPAALRIAQRAVLCGCAVACAAEEGRGEGKGAAAAAARDDAAEAEWVLALGPAAAASKSASAAALAAGTAAAPLLRHGASLILVLRAPPLGGGSARLCAALACWSPPTALAAVAESGRGDGAAWVVAGAGDGSLCVWDLREPAALHPALPKDGGGGGDGSLRVASYCSHARSLRAEEGGGGDDAVIALVFSARGGAAAPPTAAAAAAADGPRHARLRPGAGLRELVGGSGGGGGGGGTLARLLAVDALGRASHWSLQSLREREAPLSGFADYDALAAWRRARWGAPLAAGDGAADYGAGPTSACRLVRCCASVAPPPLPPPPPPPPLPPLPPALPSPRVLAVAIAASGCCASSPAPSLRALACSDGRVLLLPGDDAGGGRPAVEGAWRLGETAATAAGGEEFLAIGEAPPSSLPPLRRAVRATAVALHPSLPGVVLVGGGDGRVAIFAASRGFPIFARPPPWAVEAGQGEEAEAEAEAGAAAEPASADCRAIVGVFWLPHRAAAFAAIDARGRVAAWDAASRPPRLAARLAPRAKAAVVSAEFVGGRLRCLLSDGSLASLRLGAELGAGAAAAVGGGGGREEIDEL